MRVTVGAIIVKKDRILLLKRNHKPFKDFWCFPGGHVENGETAEKAIVREVKEETGLRFKPKFYCYNDEIFKRIKWYALSIIFKGSVGGKINFPKREVKDVGWFKFKEARKLELAFNHDKILEKFLKKPL